MVSSVHVGISFHLSVTTGARFRPSQRRPCSTMRNFTLLFAMATWPDLVPKSFSKVQMVSGIRDDLQMHALCPVFAGRIGD